MAFAVTIPNALMDAACPAGDLLQNAGSLEAFTGVVATAFNLAEWLQAIEAQGCRLVYLDLSDHPFRIVGDAWAQWGLTPVTAPVGVVAPGDGCRLDLPFSDDAVARLRAQAPWFGLPPERPEAVVPAMLRILTAMQGFERTVDGRRIKPVVRGRAEDLQRLAQRIALEGFGGVEDDDASVGSEEVWGLAAEEERRPAFFLFGDAGREEA